MAKGPRVSNDLKRIIAAVYREHRDWRTKEIQAEINRVTNGRAPGISALQKNLVEIRNNEATSQFKNQDRVWSLGTLEEFPMPPEVIPKLLETQRRLSGTVTIRQAKWMARLFSLIKESIPLIIASIAYAHYDERCELTGQPCDTFEFDGFLLDNRGERKVHKMIMDIVEGEGWSERWNEMVEKALNDKNQPNQP